MALNAEEAKEWGNYYLQLGLIPIPIRWDESNTRSCGKVPIGSGWQHTTHESALNNLVSAAQRLGKINIGLLTGKISNIIVLDVDVKDNGVKFFDQHIKQRLNREGYRVPVARTGSGGYHLFFQWNPDTAHRLRTTSKIKIQGETVGIDIRSDGGQVVAEPSIHISGGKYEFIFQEWDKIQPIPSWLEDLLSGEEEEEESTQPPTRSQNYPEDTTEEKHTKIRELLPLLSDARADHRDDWMKVCLSVFRYLNMSAESKEIVIEFSQRSPKYSDRDSRKQIDSFYKDARRERGYGLNTLINLAKQDNPAGFQQWQTKWSKKKTSKSQEAKISILPSGKEFNIYTANAELWAERIAKERENSIVLYKGIFYAIIDPMKNIWEGLEKEDILGVVGGEMNRIIEQDAGAVPNERTTENKELLRVYEKIDNTANNVIRYLRLLIKNDEFFDTDLIPNWLPLQDGHKYNLLTGEFSSIQAEERCRKTASINKKDILRAREVVNKECKNHKVDQIRELIVGLAMNENGHIDEDVLKWHLKRSFYILSGYNSWDTFYVMRGKGGDGKSTFAYALTKILGGLAYTIKNESVEEGKGFKSASGHDAHLVNAIGTRLIFIDDLEDKTMNEGFIKKITGGVAMPIRAIGKEERSYELQAKLIMTTNYILKFVDIDANRRRLRGQRVWRQYKEEEEGGGSGGVLRLKDSTVRDFIIKNPFGRVVFFAVLEGLIRDYCKDLNFNEEGVKPLPIKNDSLEMLSITKCENAEQAVSQFLSEWMRPTESGSLKVSDVLKYFQDWNAWARREQGGEKGVENYKYPELKNMTNKKLSELLTSLKVPRVNHSGTWKYKIVPMD